MCEKINWRKDEATREFRERYAEELKEISEMDIRLLGEAVTYCDRVINPFSEEITRRARNHKAYILYREAGNIDGMIKTVKNAAAGFGIRFI